MNPMSIVTPSSRMLKKFDNTKEVEAQAQAEKKRV